MDTMGLASKSCVLIIVVCCFVFQIYAQRNKGWLEVNIPDQGKLYSFSLLKIFEKSIKLNFVRKLKIKKDFCIHVLKSKFLK